MTNLSNQTVTPKSYFTEPSTELCTKIVDYYARDSSTTCRITLTKIFKESLNRLKYSTLHNRYTGGKWQLKR